MLKYWLWLAELPGLTNQSRLALLRRFASPEELYYADPEEALRSTASPGRRRRP